MNSLQCFNPASISGEERFWFYPENWKLALVLHNAAKQGVLAGRAKAAFSAPRLPDQKRRDAILFRTPDNII
jgi:hypothetical protein